MAEESWRSHVAHKWFTSEELAQIMPFPRFKEGDIPEKLKELYARLQIADNATHTIYDVVAEGFQRAEEAIRNTGRRREEIFASPGGYKEYAHVWHGHLQDAAREYFNTDGIFSKKGTKELLGQALSRIDISLLEEIVKTYGEQLSSERVRQIIQSPQYTGRVQEDYDTWAHAHLKRSDNSERGKQEEQHHIADLLAYMGLERRIDPASLQLHEAAGLAREHRREKLEYGHITKEALRRAGVTRDIGIVDRRLGIYNQEKVPSLTKHAPTYHSSHVGR